MSFNAKIFISYSKDQLEQNQAFGAIRDVKSQLKELLEYQESFYRTLRSDLLSQNPLYYQSKLAQYNQELILARQSLAEYEWQKSQAFLFPDIFREPFFFGSDPSRLKKKIAVLEKLMALIYQAMEQDSARVFIQILNLEQELRLLDQPFAYFPYEVTPLQKTKALTETLKSLRSRLRYILKRRYAGFFRDLRQHIRNLLHFLFKNMSDESGDHDSLLYADRKQELFTKLNLHQAWILKRSLNI